MHLYMTVQQLRPISSLESINECPQQPMAHLLDLVQSYDWPSVLSRLISHPHEASNRGPHGRTALHMACDHDAPASVIRALLAAFPEAASMVGTSDMNPLHITCSSQHASVEVVKVLLEGSPTEEQTMMRDVDGDTALHTACRCGAPIEVLEVLLKADPTAVDKRDFEGLTPLLRLWVRYFVTLGDDVILSVQGSQDLVGLLGEAWEKTILLLKYAQSQMATSRPKKPMFLPLHAVAAIDCPRPVIKICKTIYPEQINIKDEHGRTPLQIAIAAPIYKNHDLSVDGYNYELLDDLAARDELDLDGGYGESDHQMLSDERIEESYSSAEPSVIEILLENNLSIARETNKDGRLPLSEAILRGKSWYEGVKLILRAYPDGLSISDPPTNLYPFMLAAVEGNNTLTTVYELLKSNPELVRGGITSKEISNGDSQIIPKLATKKTSPGSKSREPNTSLVLTSSPSEDPASLSTLINDKKVSQEESLQTSQNILNAFKRNSTSNPFSDQCSISSESESPTKNKSVQSPPAIYSTVQEKKTCRQKFHKRDSKDEKKSSK